jgi:hypothetical protein
MYHGRYSPISRRLVVVWATPVELVASAEKSNTLEPTESFGRAEFKATFLSEHSGERSKEESAVLADATDVIV